MPNKKTLAFSIISVLIGAVLTIVSLEIVFRILPTSDSFLYVAVNSENPIAKLEPNRDILISRGWNFQPRATKHVNNAGFLNDQDYTTTEASPLLAIIGDSFVEAAQVENSAAMHALVAEQTPNPGRVYSFGISGAPLSQYLMEAEHAISEYGAEYLVFVVVGNDFDESLADYKQTPGQHYFDAREDGSYALIRVDYTPSRLKRIAKNSALLRYLVINLQVSRISWQNTISRFLPGPNESFVGNTSSAAGYDRLDDSRKAVDEFFRRLTSQLGIASERVLLVIDGARPQLYDSETLALFNNSYFALMQQYFITMAKERGIEIVDLQPTFIEEYTKNNTRFEFPTDAHWNEAAHSVVARRILESGVYGNFRSDTEQKTE